MCNSLDATPPLALIQYTLSGLLLLIYMVTVLATDRALLLIVIFL